MNNKKSSALFACLVTGLVAFASPVLAKDPEAAARQAEIDADEAKVKIDQIEEREQGVTEVDGLSAPELRADDAEIAVESEAKAGAERRFEEAQAEQKK